MSEGGPPPPSATLRVLCLHGAWLDKRILQLSLGPLSKAASRRGVTLQLVYENGRLTDSVVSETPPLSPP